VDEHHDDPLLTVDEVIQLLAQFTPEQRSLAWSPQPPFRTTGASDCRIGGNCGLDLNYQSPRARWVQARYRDRKQRRKDKNAYPENTPERDPKTRERS
jgi:hypothetical protein